MSSKDLEELDALIAQASALEDPVPVRQHSRPPVPPLHHPNSAQPSVVSHSQLPLPVSRRRSHDAPAASALPPQRSAVAANGAKATVPASELESLELEMERQYSADLSAKVEVRRIMNVVSVI